MGTFSQSWLPLAGDQAVVRSLREHDLSALYELEADPWVKRYIVGKPFSKPREDWLRDAQALCSSNNTFCIARSKSDTFLGRASVGHYIRDGRPTDRELQVLLRRSAVGSGVGREVCTLLMKAAKECLGATRLFAEVHPDHPHSPALVHSLGFKEEEPRIASDGQVVARIFVFNV